MDAAFVKKLLSGALAVLGIWLGVRYLLPVMLPFVLGAGLALGAEPAVCLGVRRLRLPRTVASGIGVILTLSLAVGLVWLVAAVVLREVKSLTAGLPDIQTGSAALKSWLTRLADRAPQALRAPARQLVGTMFEGRIPMLSQLSQTLPGMLRQLLSGLGSSALGIGTGVLSAFLISVRLPRLRSWLAQRLPDSWHTRYLPALRRVRHTLWGWLKAQLKLSGVTWVIVSVGFWILRIPYFALWSTLVAAIDAIPILGTGIVLGPWAALSFVQGDHLRGVGLLCIYGAAALTRTVLEPRLVGKHLGLDPLTTLVALYAGFRLWGVAGLLLTPILASAAKSLLAEPRTQKG